MDADEFKEQIALAVEGTADWRAQKAEEYPHDTRNARSAEALSNLALRLRQLPADHPKFTALWWLWYRPKSEAIESIENLVTEESRYIGRYGFDEPKDGEPVEFLDGLKTALESELSISRGKTQFN